MDLNLGSSFSFSRFSNWSPQEIEDMHMKSTFYALFKQDSFQKILTWLEYANTWDYPIPKKYLLLTASISLKIISLMTTNRNLFFTRWVSLKPYKSVNSIFLMTRCLLLLNLVVDRYRSIRSLHSLNILFIRWPNRLNTELFDQNRQNW